MKAFMTMAQVLHRNDLKVVVDGIGVEMGAPINARMGLNTWAAFYGSDADAVVAIVAMHHHMRGTTPDVFFLHYWGRGPAQKLAAGVRAAVDQLARPAR